MPLISNDSDKKKELSAQFWTALYQASYAEADQNIKPGEFLTLLDELEQMFRYRQHLAVVEMPLSDIGGKNVLEIGSGSGAHSALFALHGANVTAVDLSLERVSATARKFDLLHADNAISMNSDCERLPFCDESFDLTYANGVLHHTSDTDRAVSEIYRVLKPGGKAVIMLYAKYSFYYLIRLWFIRGLLRGKMRQPNWLGRNTEWMAAQTQAVFNPVTKVYSATDVRRMFSKFKHVQLRKNSFHYSYIPRIGREIQNWARRNMPISQAGQLVYGEPCRYETRLEMWLGKYMGFGLNILAVK